MPRSPAGRGRLARYEDAWETINRLIREGGSWSGHERNRCYLGTPSGRFVDVSAVAGFDHIEDGRGIALADLDRDGDLDVVLKSRGEPQIRVLRNVVARPGTTTSLLLEGKAPSNRDAVGARVTVHAAGRSMLRSVTCGSGFLSQSTRWLVFATGAAKAARRVEIEWPSGRRQVVEGIPCGRRYRVREGEEPRVETPAPAGAPRSRPPPPPPRESGRVARGAGGAGGPVAVWLLDDLHLPATPLKALDGGTFDPAPLRGRAVVMTFFSRRCTTCAEELAAWARERGALERAGVEVLAVSADGTGEADRRAARAFLDRLGVPFHAAAAGDRARVAYGVLVHQTVRWPVDLVVPMSLLVDRRGVVARLYRGRVEAAALVRDAALLAELPRRRAELALPFRGVRRGESFARDLFALGLGYWERGLPEEAFAAFAAAARRRPDDPDTHYNLGVILSDRGDLESAAAALGRAVALDPRFADAHINLGVVLARRGDLDGALEHFRTAGRLRPGYVEAILNEANVLMARGELGRAIELYERACELEPLLPEAHRRLGEAYHRRGDEVRSEAAFRAALEMRPDDPDILSNLAVVLAGTGRLEEARRLLERAVEKAPESTAARVNLGLILGMLGDDDGALEHLRRARRLSPDRPEPLLNLARVLARRGRRAEALRLLDAYLRRHPGDAAVAALRRSLAGEP